MELLGFTECQLSVFSEGRQGSRDFPLRAQKLNRSNRAEFHGTPPSGLAGTKKTLSRTIEVTREMARKRWDVGAKQQNHRRMVQTSHVIARILQARSRLVLHTMNPRPFGARCSFRGRLKERPKRKKTFLGSPNPSLHVKHPHYWSPEIVPLVP